jgi:hypothetical protein
MTTRSARPGIGALSQRTGRYTCAQVKRITIHHRDDVRREMIADLRKVECTPAGYAGTM